METDHNQCLPFLILSVALLAIWTLEKSIHSNIIEISSWTFQARPIARTCSGVRMRMASSATHRTKMHSASMGCHRKRSAAWHPDRAQSRSINGVGDDVAEMIYERARNGQEHERSIVAHTSISLSFLRRQLNWKKRSRETERERTCSKGLSTHVNKQRTAIDDGDEHLSNEREREIDSEKVYLHVSIRFS